MKPYHFFFLLMGALTLTSCNEFLKEDPKEILPASDTFENDNDLYLNGVAALYLNVGGFNDSEGLQGTRRGVWDLNTFTTDEAIVPTRGTDWLDGGFWQGLFTHNWGTENSAINDTWSYLYRSILRCNVSLERMKNYAETTGTDVSGYRDEVRALRALFYFYALDLYGRVPVFTSPDPDNDQLSPRPRSEVFDFVRRELLETVPRLAPDRSNHVGTYYSRMTQGVGYFLLAKLALNAEVYCHDNWTSTPRPDGKLIIWHIGDTTCDTWQAVSYFCDRLYQLGYRLEDHFENNFLVKNENSIENVFTIPMDKQLYTNQFTNMFRSRHYNHAAAIGLNGENGPCATIEALKAFGLGTQAQDTRFNLTYYAGPVNDLKGNPVLLDDGTPLIYEPWQVKLDLSSSPYEKTAGARMKKYAIDLVATKDGNQSDNDIVLFRYADALLMQAEALLRDMGPNETSTALVNQVRTRAGMPALDNVTLDDLLDERLRELAWEGWRRNDMVRYGTFNRAYTDHPADPDNHTIVFPIPAIFLNLTAAPQNPGY